MLTSTWWRVKTPSFSAAASTEMKSSLSVAARSSTFGETYAIIPSIPSIRSFMRFGSPRLM